MTKKTQKKLSLICPVLNEEEVIDLFLEAVKPYLEESKSLMGKGSSYEILFVDDGSKDQTAHIIAERAKKEKYIKLIRLSRNFGKEAALAAALQSVSGDAVIPIDVDLQDPPEMIVKMVKAWLGGAEVVNAQRVDRQSDIFLKRLTSGAFYKFFNLISKNQIPNDVGDFRLLDRVVVDAINDFSERNRFMKLIFSWVGYNQVTIEYTRPERVAGKTKFNWWKLWNLALDGITGSTTVPLRMWTYIGIIMSLITLSYAAFVVVKTLFYGNDAPGYASLMVVILAIGSFNFISLGILGEYIGRISEEVRNRPLYIIQQKIGFEEEEKSN